MDRSSPKPRSASDRLRAALLARDAQRRSGLKRLAAAARPVPPRNDLLPRLRLQDRELKTLKPPRRNVRVHTEAHVREVANAITALGFRTPILITADGSILDGVVRVEAAALLGLARVPCVVVDDLSATEARLLRLAANRLGEKGEWDLEHLKVELEELIVEDVSIEIAGFELTELDGILAVEQPGQVEVGPVDPELSRDAVARAGDVYQLGPHRVLCGDARDPHILLTLMNETTARLVLTDEPYNVRIAGHVSSGRHREFAMASGEMSEAEFLAFNDAWIAAATRHLVDGGLLTTYIDWRGLSSVSAAAVAAGLSQINLVVWAKTNAGMGSLFRSQHELLPIFKKGEAPHVNNVAMGGKGRWRSNLWTYPGATVRGSDARRGLKDHPTVKPVAMLADALLDLTHRGEVVLDPFLGSGSMVIAAEKTGRVCFGVELDPLYVDVIARRYREHSGTQAILEATGETFAAVERRRALEAEAKRKPVTSGLRVRSRPPKQ